MEIEKTYIHRKYEKGRAGSQVTIDEDYNLVDYKPDIVKVMKARGDVRFDNIRINDEHIYVKGNLCFEVLYRNDMADKKLDCLNGSIPFEEMLCMDGVDELDPVHVTAEMEDITIGIINSRKLSIRALFMLSAVVQDVKKEQIVTDIHSDDPLEMMRSEKNVLQLCTCKRDKYRMKQEIPLGANQPNVEQILWKSVQLRGIETRLSEESVQISGEALLYILYYAQGEDRRLEWLEQSVPIRGSVPCEEYEDNLLYRIKVEQGNTELEVQADYDGEDRVLSLDMTLELDICIWREEKLNVVEDVYSLEKEIVPSYEDVTLEQLLAKNYAKCRISDRLTIEPQQNDILQICSCEGKVCVDETKVMDQGVQVEGSLEIELMYVTTDDAIPVGTFKGTLGFEQFIEVPYATGDMSFELDTGLEQLTALLADNGRVDIKAVINLNLLAFSGHQMARISELKEQEMDMESLQKRPGMVGYLVKDGDTLWNIAKGNHTTMSQLMEINGLEQTKIEKGDKLLIVKTV
ncbi:MAG: SPOCS domain-containing protein [Roseburia sp.]